MRTGGANLYGRPRFRLAWTPSRFLISGSKEVNRFDEHGNYISSRMETVFVPRYAMIEPQFQDSYVLERWRPAEWYAKNGFGGAGAFEYDGAAAVQVREPVWSQGGYEAVLRDIEDPWIFSKDVSTWTIWKAIRWTLISESYSVFQKVFDRQDARRMERERISEERIEKIKHMIGPFGAKSFSAYGQDSRR